MFGISMDTISESPTVCKSLSEVLLMSSLLSPAAMPCHRGGMQLLPGMGEGGI